MQPSKPSISGETRRRQDVASSSTNRPSEPMLGGFTRIENHQNQERDDSWIEISSQPSDDTYSSADDILGDGLTLNPASRGTNVHQRKRKLRRNEILPGRTGTNKVYDYSADDLSEAEVIEGSLSSGPGSSIGELPQHEDFESSSSAAGEEDEEISSEEGEIGDEEEDTGTMLGVGYRNDVRPHHHHHHHHHPRIPQRYSTHSVSEFHRSLESHPSHSFLRHRNSHSGGNSGRQVQAHPHPYAESKEHHDEALMASLSTLLSCAAAARGLPKVAQQGTSSPGGPSRGQTMSSSRVQLDTLHLVPDQVMSEAQKPPTTAGGSTSSCQEKNATATTGAAISPDHTTRSSDPGGASSASRDSSKKTSTTTAAPKKRSSSTSKPRTRSSSPRRRTSRLTSTLSSTDASLLTLAVSAGAVIILSAISFSAGYVLGKEVGKTEAEAVGSVVGRTGSVVREAQRGGRGLLGGAGRVVSVSA